MANDGDEETCSANDGQAQAPRFFAGERECMGNRICKPDADRGHHFGAVPDIGYACAGVCRFMIPREGPILHSHIRVSAVHPG